MRILVTGSAGHLGEGLVRSLRSSEHEVRGLDLRPSPFTELVGSISDRDTVAAAVRGVDVVLHAAALHKPHVVTHSRQDFVRTNVLGTRTLLEAAAAAGVRAFVLSSTTSVFGRTLVPGPDRPAAWIDEGARPWPRNVYGETKLVAERLCARAHLERGLPCVVLRLARFFPEEDDSRASRDAFAPDNAKANELLHRRVDLEDAVGANLAAMRRAPQLGFGRYVISASTPLCPEDLLELRRDAPAVVARRVPEHAEVYAARGWRLPPAIERVYVNALDG